MSEATLTAPGIGLPSPNAVPAWRARAGLLVPGAALGVYLVISLWLPKVVSGSLSVYVVQPLLWLGVAGVALACLRLTRVSLPFSRSLLVIAALVGLFQLSILVMAGLLLGFGHSPYARSPLGMAQNVVYFGTALVGLELTRAYLITVLARRNSLAALAVVSLFCAALAVPYGKFLTLGEPGTAFSTTGGTFLPGLSESLLASFLVLLGGPLASIAYLGILEAFEWLSPILPDLEWTTRAFVGTLTPALALLIVRGLYLPDTAGEGEAEARGLSMGWIMVAAVAVAVVWFNTGLLGVQPHLISGVSMEPALRVGDIVVTREIDPEDVRVGDVIQFTRGGPSIMHRVIEVQPAGGQPVFVTQGDNNNRSDEPVLASQVQGEVVFVIPKLGWVPIGFRKFIDRWT